jgi:TolB protein
MEPKIAFSRVAGPEGTAIWSVNSDGSDLLQLTHPPQDARDTDPSWSPDRRSIAFVRAIVVGEDFRGDFIRYEYLSVMNAKGGALRRLALHSHDPAWSPDGKRIAFVKHYAGDEEIWTIKPDGSGARSLARGDRPTWSPDGRRIAFSRYLGGISAGEVFVMNSDGTGQHRLLATNYESQAPAWSPDGRRIAFLAWSNNSLQVARADGRDVKRLAGGVSSKDTAEPRWSPDGSQLLFERDGAPDAVFVVRSVGGGLKRIATDTDYPDWSPDGRKVAFAVAFRALRVVSATGGRSTRVSRGVAWGVDW